MGLLTRFFPGLTTQSSSSNRSFQQDVMSVKRSPLLHSAEKIAASLQLPMVIADGSGCVTFMNPACLRLLADCRDGLNNKTADVFTQYPVGLKLEHFIASLSGGLELMHTFAGRQEILVQILGRKFSVLKEELTQQNGALVGYVLQLTATQPELKYYEQLASSLTTALMLVDHQQTIVYINSACKQVLRTLCPEILQAIPDDQLIGHPAMRFLQSFELRADFLQSQADQDWSLLIGEQYWQFTSKSLPSGYAAMHPLHMVQIQPIQRQEDSKHLMPEVENKLLRLQLDNAGKVCYLSPALLALMGKAADELLGKNFTFFWSHQSEQQAIVTQLLIEMQKGQVSTAELKVSSSLHTLLWLAVEMYPMMSEGGQLKGGTCIFRDMTAAKLEKTDRIGQINAIHLTQAVIEFSLDGTIVTANQNFLDTVGYQLDEIKGRHHSLFVDEQYKRSVEYQHFWQRLRSGEFFVDEFKRVGKGGKEIWIQASYNPIFDTEGKPYKVVKYAVNITQRKMVVNTIKEVMTQLSRGNLNTDIDPPFAGEFAELGQTVSQFIYTLRQIISEINNAAATIKMAASEISDGTTDLSSRTEQQASSLEETASSMEELTSTVKQNSENAGQANLLASKASDIAADGGKLIEQVVTTMVSINDSAQKIADIIGVIDGIAFQTNILALNAAVEAARAGEQGRGFAVVASEVRSLAQRSASAAKDIKSLISDSVNKIRNGNELVDRSGATMKEIVLAITRVNDLMAEIAAASAEQAGGIDEINKAVTQMDEMTQQNAALVEESAAASESLLTQAEQLYEHVALFSLNKPTERAMNASIVTAPRRSSPPSATVRAPHRAAVPSSRAVPPKRASRSAREDADWESF
jgi:methyl-accepting chemotaxis protein